MFFLYIKISKDSSARYYQKKKETIQKSIMKGMKIFQKRKNKKGEYSRE